MSSSRHHQQLIGGISDELCARNQPRVSRRVIGQLVSELQSQPEWNRLSRRERVTFAADAWMNRRKTPRSPRRLPDWVAPDWLELYGLTSNGTVRMTVTAEDAFGNAGFFEGVVLDRDAPALGMLLAASVLQEGALGPIQFEVTDAHGGHPYIEEFLGQVRGVTRVGKLTGQVTEEELLAAAAELATLDIKRLLQSVGVDMVGQDRWHVSGDGSLVRTWVETGVESMRHGQGSVYLHVKPAYGADGPIAEVGEALAAGIAALRPDEDGPGEDPFTVTARWIVDDGVDEYVEESR